MVGMGSTDRQPQRALSLGNQRFLQLQTIRGGLTTTCGFNCSSVCFPQLKTTSVSLPALLISEVMSLAAVRCAGEQGRSGDESLSLRGGRLARTAQGEGLLGWARDLSCHQLWSSLTSILVPWGFQYDAQVPLWGRGCCLSSNLEQKERYEIKGSKSMIKYGELTQHRQPPQPTPLALCFPAFQWGR